MANSAPRPTFAPEAGQIVTVFRSYLHEPARDRYEVLAAEIDALAVAQPGFLERKAFVAADGERVTLVTFADRASHDAWRDHVRHREAQAEGRGSLYDAYLLQVATVGRARAFRRRDDRDDDLTH